MIFLGSKTGKVHRYAMTHDNVVPYFLFWSQVSISVYKVQRLWKCETKIKRPTKLYTNHVKNYLFIYLCIKLSGRVQSICRLNDQLYPEKEWHIFLFINNRKIVVLSEYVHKPAESPVMIVPHTLQSRKDRSQTKSRENRLVRTGRGTITISILLSKSTNRLAIIHVKELKPYSDQECPWNYF